MSIEAAWAAGFFDGEGWIGVQRPGAQLPTLKVGIFQNDREVLDRFLAAVGGEGHVNGPYERPGVNRHFQYQVNGYARCVRIMEILVPYLGRIKREQYEAARASVEETGIPHEQAGPVCRRGHIDWRITPRGRICRTCQNMKNRESRARQAVA